MIVRTANKLVRVEGDLKGKKIGKSRTCRVGYKEVLGEVLVME